MCHQRLTYMQRDVLWCAMAGLSVDETAVLLERSRHTVKIHRTHILSRLGADNIIHAAALYLMEGRRDVEFWESFGEVVA